MRYLLVIGVFISLLSCDSSADGKKGTVKDNRPVNTDTAIPPVQNTDTLPLPAPEPEKTKVSEVASPCSRLAFFQPGSEIVTANYNDKGEEMSKQLVRILSIKEKKGITTATAEVFEMLTGVKEKATPSRFEYQCDGKNIFFNIESIFNQGKKNKETGVTSSLISFPIQVKEGQTLPDARGFINSQRGDKKVSMKYVFKDRKVGTIEELTTPGGTWKCYKISNAVEVEMDIPGMDENAKAMMKQMQRIMKMTTSTWLAPDFGIVKMEIYMNGELKSSNEVVAVKR